MNEIERIADELRRAYDGDPWHGSPLTSILDGVNASDAASHPIPGAHSIWEILLHIASWTDEVRNRLGGAISGEPVRGDWPRPPASSEPAWEAAKRDLAGLHDLLLRDLAATKEEKLWQFVGSPVRDRAEGTGTSYYVLLHGLVQHTVYHSAQIVMQRKMIRAGRDEVGRH